MNKIILLKYVFQIFFHFNQNVSIMWRIFYNFCILHKELIIFKILIHGWFYASILNFFISMHLLLFSHCFPLLSQKILHIFFFLFSYLFVCYKIYKIVEHCEKRKKKNECIIYTLESWYFSKCRRVFNIFIILSNSNYINLKRWHILQVTLKIIYYYSIV